VGKVQLYESSPPSAYLAPYVKSYYRFEYAADGIGFLGLTPTGTAEVTYIREPATVPPTSLRPFRGLVAYTQLSSSYRNGLRNGCVVYGIVLHPLGMARFFDGDFKALGQMVVNDGLALPGCNEIFAPMASAGQAPSFAAFRERAEAVLYLGLAKRPELPDWLFGMVSVMNQGGWLVPQIKLAEQLPVSWRRFESVFADTIGCSPKTYLRVLRYRRFLWACAQPRRMGLAQLATDCGFYDQAHLCHEIQALGGKTPGHYLKGRITVYGL